MTRLLAEYFDTVYVEEMARYIISRTQEVLFEDLQDIAVLHAETINRKQAIANKLLFVDTDINITQSYAHYLFDKELEVQDRIKKANRCDLYLFLEPDCEYVQDGTRLPQAERDGLSQSHKQQLLQAGISYETIQGKDRHQRFEMAIHKVEEKMPASFISLPKLS
jgi:HTH-type transcriptional regulator, transcriptional repressor of NAD biosynthesis genes